MSDTTNTGDGERASLAPILAPIITLFIGFGAGVVFSEFIPMGKAPIIQPAPSANPSTGPRVDPRAQEGEDAQDAEIRNALEEAAAEGDEASQKALDDMTPAEDTAPNGG